MHIVRRRGWEIAERLVTPEHAVLNRRVAAGRRGGDERSCRRWRPGRTSPANPAFKPGRAVTEEKYATTYNNYYEFGESKNIWRDAQALKQRPWTIKLDGMMAKPRTIDIDDLLKQVSLEERIYRHRCVEAWAMTVPWTGFPLSQLLKIAEPLGSAKYVVFETAQDKVMSGLNAPFYPWPYVEGVTIDEAANDLAFISTGHVRQAAAAAERRPDPADPAVEIRLQVRQGDRQDQLHRKAPDDVLGGDRAVGIRLLGQREPRRGPSALEPGVGTAAGQRRKGANADF